MEHGEKIILKSFGKVKWNDLIELFKSIEKCRVNKFFFSILSAHSWKCCRRVIQFAKTSLDFKSNHILSFQKSCLILWTWIDFKISDYVKRHGAACMQHLSLFSTHITWIKRIFMCLWKSSYWAWHELLRRGNFFEHLSHHFI